MPIKQVRQAARAFLDREELPASRVPAENLGMRLLDEHQGPVHAPLPRVRDLVLPAFTT
ncbi:hypothetical protein ACFWQL_04540 [Amycolatopsis thermoflava]|uniref:hypothetical protein n=1 Tax=Amycolatopsis thermoflava TaxID=84480 RepID=UPI00365FAF80